MNWVDEEGLTALHHAAFYGHSKVVKLLLAHPAIDVNMQDHQGDTPFVSACAKGSLTVVRQLLKDPRVNTAQADGAGCTPLWKAVNNGGTQILSWFIASGRDMGDLTLKARLPGGGFNILEIARVRDARAATLLERFMANPTQTRHALRVRLELPDTLAAENFALIIFLCDGLLQHKPTLDVAVIPNPVAAAAASRFFAIVERLPMELQTILCHLVVGSTRENIPLKDSEAAFKNLARILLLIQTTAL